MMTDITMMFDDAELEILNYDVVSSDFLMIFFKNFQRSMKMLPPYSVANFNNFP